jgi:hypothetical protein
MTRIITIILLIGLSAVGWCRPGSQVNFIEDDRSRPVLIETYYLDGNGTKVLHGRCIEYYWSISLRVEVVYQDGYPVRTIIGRFNKAKLLP